MVTEAFHRLLKDVYCERKQNRRVDHLLAKLLVIACDKAYESWIKQEKGKVTYKIYEMNIRHRRAKDILPSDIVQDADDESKWKVSSRSQDGETYTIHYHGPCTAVCNVKCQTCHVCRHSYSCTCADSSLHALACKHIHTVHISVSNGEDNVLPDIDVSPLAEEEQERRNRENITKQSWSIARKLVMAETTILPSEQHFTEISTILLIWQGIAQMPMHLELQINT